MTIKRKEKEMDLKNTNLKISLDRDKAELSFGEGIVFDKQAGKTVSDMEDLLYDTQIDAEEQLYNFYIGIADSQHCNIIRGQGLRYDLIVIPAGTVGSEFKKTSGHRHIGSYPEIYEVLQGTAMFLLQKERNGRVEQFAAVRTKEGEKILVPPGYTHATVNIGKDPLVFADVVADACVNEYGIVKENHGMAYYLLKKRDGQVGFRKNPYYDAVSEVKEIMPVESAELGLWFQKPVYECLCRDINRYQYLIDPEAYIRQIHYLADIIEEKEKR